MTEYYPENLQTLLAIMDALPAMASIDGVFEIEVRVRVDDIDSWVTIGYGEAGDPCVLRFETPIKQVGNRLTAVFD